MMRSTWSLGGPVTSETFMMKGNLTLISEVGRVSALCVDLCAFWIDTCVNFGIIDVQSSLVWKQFVRVFEIGG